MVSVSGFRRQKVQKEVDSKLILQRVSHHVQYYCPRTHA